MSILQPAQINVMEMIHNYIQAPTGTQTNLQHAQQYIHHQMNKIHNLETWWYHYKKQEQMRKPKEKEVQQ